MKRRTALVAAFVLVLALFAKTPSSRAHTTDAPHIRLQAGSFDPLASLPALPASLQADEATMLHGLVLIQFAGPIEEAWKIAMQDAGVRLFGYVPEYAFIARLGSATPEQLQQFPFVRWIGPYQPTYKLDAAFTNAATQPSGQITIDVHATPDADIHAFEQQINGWNGTLLERTQNEWATYGRVALPTARVGDVARLSDVLWVAPYTPPSVANSVAGGSIMGANTARTALDLYGKGQIVAVADTGLDTGAMSSLHADVAGRVRTTYCLGRPSPCNWSDPHGHGTHVVGSVLGNGAASNSNPAEHRYNGSQAGVAPEASLVLQSIGDSGGGLSGIPQDNGKLIRQAYDAGARIQTNSWGTPSPESYGSYTMASHQLDAAAWDLKEMLVLFAAGNGGIDANKDGVVDNDSIFQQGTAKNVIAAGASESVQPAMQRTWRSLWQDRFVTAPIADDLAANNANGMAAFSGRGPTDDGRVKPDVVAPGTFILSMRSRIATAQTYWAEYNNEYAYNSGTSMSTPLTAGAAALTREWLSRVHALTKPSAALVKALLLNGAANMQPGQYGSTKPEVPSTQPNNVSGWGRVDLAQTLVPPAPRATWFTDNTHGLATGERAQHTLRIGEASAQAAATNSTPAPNTPLVAAPMPADTSIMAASQSVQNGGFERGVLTPWHTSNTQARLDSAARRTGAWGVVLGDRNDALDQILQQFTMPSDAKTISLSFWYRSFTQEKTANADQACFGLWPELGQTPIVARCLDFAKLGNRGWGQETVTLNATEVAAAQGKIVRMGIYVTSNGAATSELWLDDIAVDVDTTGAGQSVGSTPARVTLAWTDYPGQPTAAKALVNDLDLEVITPNGTHYHGNGGVYGTTHRCMRGGQWDTCNNVEGVTLPAVPGQYTVIVHGANVPQGGRQPFAVVATGDYAHSTFEHTLLVPVAGQK